MILISSLAHFGVPSILGFSKNIYTLPTMIYALIYTSSGSFEGIRQGAALSILLVAGLALLALAVTRKSGMDEPGRRVSSVSVQIVGSVLITGGLLLLAYSGYVIWQVVPGLNVSASWAVQGANVSAVVGIAGVAMLAFGLLLALRQITAAPLSRLGLIGAPPAPPKR